MIAENMHGTKGMAALNRLLRNPCYQHQTEVQGQFSYTPTHENTLVWGGGYVKEGGLKTPAAGISNYTLAHCECLKAKHEGEGRFFSQLQDEFLLN